MKIIPRNQSRNTSLSFARALEHPPHIFLPPDHPPWWFSLLPWTPVYAGKYWVNSKGLSVLLFIVKLVCWPYLDILNVFFCKWMFQGRAFEDEDGDHMKNNHALILPSIKELTKDSLTNYQILFSNTTPWNEWQQMIVALFFQPLIFI